MLLGTLSISSTTLSTSQLPANQHHPLLCRVLRPSARYSVERDYLIELGGLRVPAHLDCDIFNAGEGATWYLTCSS